MNRTLLPVIAPSAAAVSLLAAALLSGCASAPETVAMPEALKARPSEKLAMVVPAKGVQIYECKAKAGQAGAYEWAFVAPEADLFDRSGAKIGTHYAGPTWESRDGSKIKGTVKARADAPQPDAIPWLLLTTTADGPKGTFSAVTSVQRVNTVGGAAPKTACGAGNTGAVARVPYTADYYLLAER
jgi:hypothetical protein